MQLYFMKHTGHILGWFMLLQLRWFLRTAANIEWQPPKICLVNSLPSAEFSPIKVVGKVASSVSIITVLLWRYLKAATLTEEKVSERSLWHGMFRETRTALWLLQSGSEAAHGGRRSCFSSGNGSWYESTVFPSREQSWRLLVQALLPENMQERGVWTASEMGKPEETSNKPVKF